MEHKQTVKITVCENGYYLETEESVLAFSDNIAPGMNNYSPALKNLIEHLIYNELAEDNGNKYGRRLCVEECSNE